MFAIGWSAWAEWVGFQFNRENFREDNVLVLSRKIGESIVIADEITVRVLEVCGSRVRLGIEAPKSVSIHRSEVFESIHEFAIPANELETVVQ